MSMTFTNLHLTNTKSCKLINFTLLVTAIKKFTRPITESDTAGCFSSREKIIHSVVCIFNPGM